MRWAASPLLLLALVACATQPTPSPSATQRPGAKGIELPEPARPYAAADVIDAMRASPRPGGVPDQLESDAVAAAVAELLWTFDGQPWPTLVTGGSCGSTECTLEVSGTPAGAVGPDLYVFSVALEAADVELVDASLRGLSGDLGRQLDAVARTIAPSELQGMLLVSARWLPPPDEGTFVLAYRTGGEGGGCGLDVTLDAAIGVIVDMAPRDC